MKAIRADAFEELLWTVNATAGGAAQRVLDRSVSQLSKVANSVETVEAMQKPPVRKRGR